MKTLVSGAGSLGGWWQSPSGFPRLLAHCSVKPGYRAGIPRHGSSLLVGEANL